MTQASPETTMALPAASPPKPEINATLEPFAALGYRERSLYPPEVQDALLVLHRARSDAADQIERLLGFLNETEFDIEETAMDAIFRARFGDQPFEEEIEEREPEPEHDELTGDEEPSLGSCSASIDQSGWGATGEGAIDAEDEFDGSEDGADAEDSREDYEPSLGWTADGVTGDSSDIEAVSHG